VDSFGTSGGPHLNTADAPLLAETNGDSAAGHGLRYSVVVPVFNEAANIASFCRRALKELPGEYELLICYDTPDDSTLTALRALPVADKPERIRLVHNQLGRGVRYAIEAGFRAARSPLVLVCMVDLSDDLSSVPAMLDLAEAGAAVVCGSRYMRGGRQIGGPWLKSSLSRTAGLTLCWFTGLPTHDPTNSFKVYRTDFLKQQIIESPAGFCLGLELTVKAHFAGWRIAEVPTTWRDRTAGESRFRLWKWLPLYLHWYFYAFRARLKNVRRCLLATTPMGKCPDRDERQQSETQADHSWRAKVTCLGMLLIPFPVLLVYFLKFAVNAPALDDYDAILAFLSDFAPDHFWRALFDLGRFHNEHRIVLTRFLAWLSVMLTGRVSFWGLVGIATGLQALLAVLMVWEARRTGLRAFWLVPIPCLLLACQDPTNGLIAMYGLQNLAVHLFAGLAFACWPARRWWGIFFGVVAAGTSACGLLVLPILAGFTICMAGPDVGQSLKDKLPFIRKAGVHWVVIVAVAVWALYFWGYTTPAWHPSLSSSFGKPLKMLAFAAALASSPLRRLGDSWSPVLGAVELILMLFVLSRCNWRRNSFFVSLIAFELATVLLMSLSRSQMGVQQAYETRYRIVALALMANIYVLTAQSMAVVLPARQGKWIAVSLAGLALCCNLYTARGNFPGYFQLHRAMQQQLSSRLEDSTELVYPNGEAALRIAVEADRKGIFVWPAAQIDGKVWESHSAASR
jgi:hypothetical protein